jgi:hypothetical protein
MTKRFSPLYMTVTMIAINAILTVNPSTSPIKSQPHAPKKPENKPNKPSPKIKATEPGLSNTDFQKIMPEMGKED